MDQHPDFDTLLAFREHRLSGFVVGEVALHVGQCARCATLEASAGRTLLEALASRDVGDVRPSRRWLMAAAVGFAVVALSVVAILVRRDTERVPRVLGSSGTQGTPRPEEPRTRGTEEPVVASLADGAGKISLLADGTVTGVEPRDAEDARAVLSGRAIAIPTF